MPTIACPWCEEDAPLLLPAPETDFTCADCGTTVEIVEDPVALDLAA